MFTAENKNMPITTEITGKGNMGVGGCDTIELAKEYGTPLYVMDEVTIRNNCRNYIEACNKIYPNSEVAFASKALSVIGIHKIIKEEGLSIDVVSGGELFIALQAGIDPAKIYFHGNNKSKQEIKEALAAGVGTIVADSLSEINLIDKLAKEKNIKQNILIRITPGVEAHTHEFIRTGQLDSKFGIHADQIINIINEIKNKKNINFQGFHVHIGSQILDTTPFAYTVEIIMDLVAQIKQATKTELKVLNFGGGLGITYLDNDQAPRVEEYFSKIIETLKWKAASLKLKLPKVIIEPGRSIVGTAGITLYQVGTIKDLKGIRKYVAVDGGMADNPRPITYQAKYDALVANKIEQQKTELVTIAGKFCESGDILIKDIPLQPIKSGDIIAVLGTGAYNYAMASNYNQALKPAMVLVKSGKATLIVKREEYQDLISKQVIQ